MSGLLFKIFNAVDSHKPVGLSGRPDPGRGTLQKDVPATGKNRNTLIFLSVPEISAEVH